MSPSSWLQSLGTFLGCGGLREAVATYQSPDGPFLELGPMILVADRGALGGSSWLTIERSHIESIRSWAGEGRAQRART